LKYQRKLKVNNKNTPLICVAQKIVCFCGFPGGIRGQFNLDPLQVTNDNYRGSGIELIITSHNIMQSEEAIICIDCARLVGKQKIFKSLCK